MCSTHTHSDTPVKHFVLTVRFCSCKRAMCHETLKKLEEQKKEKKCSELHRDASLISKWGWNGYGWVKEGVRIRTRLLTLQGYAANSVARGSRSASRDQVKKPDAAESEQNSKELELNQHVLACVGSRRDKCCPPELLWTKRGHQDCHTAVVWESCCTLVVKKNADWSIFFFYVLRWYLLKKNSRRYEDDFKSKLTRSTHLVLPSSICIHADQSCW